MAAILNAATAAFFDLNLELEIEILGFDRAIDKERVASRFLARGFSDNGAVLDAPNVGIAVPTVQGSAVEDLREANVIFEVEWIGLAEASTASAASGACLSLDGGRVLLRRCGNHRRDPKGCCG